MGHEFVAGFPVQEAALEPNYWLMGLAAAPTFLVVVLELAVVVLALTDRGQAMWARYSWALIVVIAPLIGALAFLIVRGKERLRQLRRRSERSRAV
ncbi:hypothetical protein [Sinomonas gamaensis]|uniref:hypothetical protein n=1 Tax=Sinomonas gamaensis TaxID=2565624 RepID=UPI00110955D0|nr:hypothetical protein [Sinomonas gamaensis]